MRQKDTSLPFGHEAGHQAEDHRGAVSRHKDKTRRDALAKREI